MTETQAEATAPTKSKYPKSVPYIIGNEAAERFSYYGLRSILAIFLVAQFYNPQKLANLATTANAQANEKTHLFVALSYFMPLVGGIVADWFLGKYRVILWISMVYCIGNLFTSSFTSSLPLFSTGLVLIAIGAGGIKSCVSANVGDQFDKSNQNLLSKVYGWFYFSINAGSMVSTVLIPWVYANYGPTLAFGIPGLLMALATIIFFSGRKMYVRMPPVGINKNNFVFISTYASFAGRMGRGKYLLHSIIGWLAAVSLLYLSLHYNVGFVLIIILCVIVLWYIISCRAKRCHDIGKSGWYQFIPFFYIYLFFAKPNDDKNRYKKIKVRSWLDKAKGPFDPEKVEGIKAVWRVMFVFFFALGFWAVWDQNLSEWVLQLQSMDRTVSLGFTKFTIYSGQVQTFNPVFLLLFIPLFNYWIYPRLDKVGLKTTPLRRFGAGLILTAVSFVIIALIQSNIDKGGHPTFWWQVLAYVMLSAAEVLVSITGLEYAYTHSPKSMKSTMTAVWLMVVAVGNLITAWVNGKIAEGGFFAKHLAGANYYWYFDVCFIMAFVIAFMLVSPYIKERNYIDNPDEDMADHNKIVADTDNL